MPPAHTSSAAASPTMHTSTVDAAGTTFFVEQRGSGTPLLLIHGGGEDSTMLAGQAGALAEMGFAVISYDRRGTGRSGRDGWPGAGASQHADDAAALLSRLAVGPAVVLGVSTGGIIGLELASRHSGQVRHVVAWEPPAAGVLEHGAELTTAIKAPIDDYLLAHPGDYVGAQAVLLSQILGFEVDPSDPAFAAARANAEPMIRDEPQITLATFDEAAFDGLYVTIVVGNEPNDIIAAATARLAELAGTSVVKLDATHEVYLHDPGALAAVVNDHVEHVSKRG